MLASEPKLAQEGFPKGTEGAAGKAEAQGRRAQLRHTHSKAGGRWGGWESLRQGRALPGALSEAGVGEGESSGANQGLRPREFR